MNRRAFCNSVFWGGAAIGSLSSMQWLKKLDTIQLTVLHTNDTHSHIDPFPADHAKYPNQGGVMRRAGLIEQIRAENNHVLLVDAGDIFQGTPYFNMYHGELEMKLMSKMGYDAATIGNHDFDAGIEGFDKTLSHVNFPFVCSNYNFDDTILNGKTKTHQIIEKGPLKIGIIGLGIELDGLVSKNNFKDTQYLDPIEKAQENADFLKNEANCDFVICLSHLGYQYNSKKVCDTIVAQETSNIDLIIGGHTHTFLKAPSVFKNKVGKQVLVNQVGWAGINLGRIDFSFSLLEDGSVALNGHSGAPLNVV